MPSAFEHGIADSLYPKRVKGRIQNNQPPNWMNEEERMEWMKGYNYGIKQAI